MDNENLGYSCVGTFLRELRERADLTQMELATKLGDVHSQFVSNWERGKCHPPQHCLRRLGKALKLDQKQKDKLFECLLEDARHEINSRWKDIL